MTVRDNELLKDNQQVWQRMVSQTAWFGFIPLQPMGCRSVWHARSWRVFFVAHGLVEHVVTD